jgi:HAD superfamily hydrolase (TIGR01450 family)
MFARPLPRRRAFHHRLDTLLSSFRCQSTARSRPRQVGVAFDIDGVLLRGYHPLPNARESLLRLIHDNIPFIFLTNGGGEREDLKAKKLAEVLALPVHPSQVILSHTPLRPAIQQFADQKILVLGCRDVYDVAKSYGARRIFTVSDLARDDPTRYPFLHWDHVPLPGTASERAEPFGAVFILHDPNNWGVEMQVCALCGTRVC